MLALRFLLAPLLVAAASLASRAWGERVGGWLSAFPFVAGPLLLVLTLEQGASFGAISAGNALYGLVALAVFALSYAYLARWMPWWWAMPVGWLTYLGTAWLCGMLVLPIWARMVAVLFSLTLSKRLLPNLTGSFQGKALPLYLDLPLRMVAAATLVGTVASVARQMGPSWSGLLTPFPIATTILVTFAHAQSGAAAVTRLLKGFLPAVSALTLFLAILSWSLPYHGVASSFALAIACALAVQAATFWWGSKG
jgi:hypothetical protein